MEKNRAISEAKTVSLFLVIISHCMLFYANNQFFLERADIYSPLTAFLFGIIDVSVIPAFTICSGYLFIASQKRRPRSIGQNILERAKRLLIPYFLYGALWVVPLYTLFDIKAFGRPDHADLLTGYKYMLLGMFADHLWFLWMLFWVTLIFILMRPLLEGKGLILAGIISVVLNILVGLYLQGVPYYKLFNIGPYIPCFFVGVLLYYAEERIRSMPKWQHYAAVLVLLACCIAYDAIHPAHFLWNTAADIAGGLMFYVFFLEFSQTAAAERLESTGFWKYTEKYSMNIYLLNNPFIYVYFRLLYPLMGQYIHLTTLVLAVVSLASIYAAVWVQAKIKAAVFKKS